MPRPALLRLSKALEDSLHRKFFRLGVVVAHNPWRTVLATLVLTTACSAGFLRLSVQNDPLELYTAQDSFEFEHRRYVEGLWGDADRYSDIFLEAKQGNALTPEALLAFLDLHEALFDFSHEYEGEAYALADLCARVNDKCVVSSLLAVWGFNRTTIASLDQDTILSTVNSGNLVPEYGIPMALSNIVGGETRDSDGLVVGAQVLRLTFALEQHKVHKDGDFADFRANDFEVHLEHPILDTPVGHFQAYLWTMGGRDEQDSRALTADVRLIPTGYLMMVGYAWLVLARRHKIRSQSALAVASVVSVALATLSGFGIASTFVEFSLVVQASVVLLLGVGVDDTFVIINAFRLTDPNLDDATRIGRALGSAGSAIAVTSLTDFFAFCAGSYSSLPAIQVFCVYCAFGVAFDFVYQVTFFVACLALDLRRQRASRPDCLSCCKCDVPDDRDCLSPSRKFNNGDRGQISEALSNTIANVVLHRAGKVGVMVLATGLMVGGVYGALELRTEFNTEWFVPDDGNYIRQAIELRNKFFQAFNLNQCMYTREVDYFEAMDDLDLITSELPKVKHVKEGTVVNWYAEFSAWLASNSPANANDTISSSEDFASRLQEFLATDAGKPYQSNVRIDDNGVVVGTRIPFASAYTDSQAGIATRRSARALAARTRMGSDFPYALRYVILHGLEAMSADLVRNLLLAGAAVFVVCTLLLASLRLGFVVTAVLAMIDLEVLGFAYFVGLTYNAVVVINCLVSVGLAVDYNAHVAHAFMCAHGTGQERARAALVHIGGPVISGAFSTFLAVFPLVLAVSYIFRVFFVMFSGMVAISLFHGVCVMPVLLSWVGPPPHSPKAATQLRDSPSLPMQATSSTPDQDDGKVGAAQRPQAHPNVMVVV